jgi:hypothetical protein
MLKKLGGLEMKLGTNSVAKFQEMCYHHHNIIRWAKQAQWPGL